MVGDRILEVVCGSVYFVSIGPKGEFFRKFSLTKIGPFHFLPICDHFWIMLESCWNHCWTTLGSVWDHVGITLGSI